jgi:hypothetical protein
LRSRRHTIALSIAAALLVGAAAPFSPRVYWRARVAWAARGRQSADEDERWRARVALLEMPYERMRPLIPRIVAGAAADRVARGEQLFTMGQREAEKAIYPPDAPLPKSIKTYMNLGLFPPDADVCDRLTRIEPLRAGSILISVKSRPGQPGEIGLEAPLDDDGETLRLLRDELERRPR